jgi:hypothetical protein
MAAGEIFADLTGGANAGMEVWIKHRLDKRSAVNHMGMSIEWLQGKQRDPLEEEALQRLLKAARAEQVETEEENRPKMQRRGRRNSLVMREYDATDEARVTLPARKASSAAIKRSASAATGKVTKGNAQARGEYFFSQTEHATELTLVTGVKLVRMFVRKNRWRLHHLFLSADLGHDYRMTVEQIAELLGLVGGIIRLTQSDLESVSFTQAKEADGNLKPHTIPTLEVCLSTFGLGRDGLLDYRRVLDDYMGEAILEHRLRMDRVRKRQQANNQRTTGPSFRSVHDEIGRSIAETQNPYTWLVEDQKQGERTNHYKVESRPRPKSPPRDLDPLERGWLGICSCPTSHLGKCPGYNRGKGNPFLLKWYAEHEKSNLARDEAQAVQKAEIAARNFKPDKPAEEEEEETEEGLYASFTTSLSLPEGFSKEDFADFRRKQWQGYLQTKATMKLLEGHCNESKLRSARVAPREYATDT